MIGNQDEAKEGGEKERRYIISPEERHTIVANFVSDVQSGRRRVEWYGVNTDWADNIRRDFLIVSGAIASTTEERADAEVNLYKSISNLSIYGSIEGRAKDDTHLEDDVKLLRERMEQINKVLLAISKRLSDIEAKLDE